MPTTVSTTDAATPLVTKPEIESGSVDPFGPATITHWSVGAQLEQLGTYWMSFHETGVSDPWTLQYEETVFAVSGRAWIIDTPGPNETVIPLEAGDLVVLKPGATVGYGGESGTKLLLSIAPVHWG